MGSRSWDPPASPPETRPQADAAPIRRGGTQSATAGPPASVRCYAGALLGHRPPVDSASTPSACPKVPVGMPLTAAFALKRARGGSSSTCPLWTEAVAQTPEGRTGSVLRVGSKNPKVIARPRRALLGAPSAFHGRHSECRTGSRRRLCATASTTTERVAGRPAHACLRSSAMRECCAGRA
jgi:hypothetical protein